MSKEKLCKMIKKKNWIQSSECKDRLKFKITTMPTDNMSADASCGIRF